MKKVDTLRYITRGLLGFRPLGEVRDTIAAGDVIRVRLLLFHVLPAWKHEIRVIEVDDAQRRIATEEHGGAVKRWNHVIEVDSGLAGGTRYTDSIDIEAGALSPVIRGYARLFYRYRQRRWRRLARQINIPSQRR